MEYKIITGGDATYEKAAAILATRVTKELNDVWELVGGVSLTEDNSNQGKQFFISCQAIKK
jgi:hypothetical protein